MFSRFLAGVILHAVFHLKVRVFARKATSAGCRRLNPKPMNKHACFPNERTGLRGFGFSPSAREFRSKVFNERRRTTFPLARSHPIMRLPAIPDVANYLIASAELSCGISSEDERMGREERRIRYRPSRNSEMKWPTVARYL